MYAKNEITLLNNYFDRIEWFVHTGVTYLYAMTAVLINSFVELYTADVQGLSYSMPLFSLLIVLANVVYSLRTPYNLMVLSAGHFRQTQRIYYIEAGLNLTLSLILVQEFQLVGVAIATLFSMGGGTIALVFYLSKNIVLRPVEQFIKHLFVDLISFGLILLMGFVILDNYAIETILQWLTAATIVGFASLILISVINLLFYRETMISSLKGLLRRVR